MDDPTFRLEGVVKESSSLTDFEGPLALILQLLSKNKIEIKDIKISELVDQYMEYLERIKDMDLEIASEFVAMASYLVYIKARTLVTSADDARPSELEELISSLEDLKNRETYARIKEVVPHLGDMFSRGAGTYVKLPEPLVGKREYSYVHDANDLLSALLGMLVRDDSASGHYDKEEFLMPSRIVFPVDEKQTEILGLLMNDGDQQLTAFIELSKSRTEAVATFIAVLELCHLGKIGIYEAKDGVMLTKVTEFTEVQESNETGY